MARLALYLLGPPRIEVNGAPVHISRTKVVALLAYLAVAGRHSREALVTLLSPELETSRARAELCRALSSLRRALGTEWLTADRETAGLNPGSGLCLDVDKLRQQLLACGDPGVEMRANCRAAFF